MPPEVEELLDDFAIRRMRDSPMATNQEHTKKPVTTRTSGPSQDQQQPPAVRVVTPLSTEEHTDKQPLSPRHRRRLFMNSFPSSKSTVQDKKNSQVPFRMDSLAYYGISTEPEVRPYKKRKREASASSSSSAAQTQEPFGRLTELEGRQKTEEQPPKRKRGRPKGSKNKPKVEGATVVPKKRGQPKGSKNKPKTTEHSKVGRPKESSEGPTPKFSVSLVLGPPKKRLGRPKGPKSKPDVEGAVAVPKKRGRPKGSKNKPKTLERSKVGWPEESSEGPTPKLPVSLAVGPPKKKRGRPKGSKNKPKVEGAAVVPKKRGRPKGSKNKPKTLEPSKVGRPRESSEGPTSKFSVSLVLGPPKKRLGRPKGPKNKPEVEGGAVVPEKRGRSKGSKNEPRPAKGTGGSQAEPNDDEDSERENLSEDRDDIQTIPISTHQSEDFPQINDTGSASTDETVSFGRVEAREQVGGSRFLRKSEKTTMTMTPPLSRNVSGRRLSIRSALFSSPPLKQNQASSRREVVDFIYKHAFETNNHRESLSRHQEGIAREEENEELFLRHEEDESVSEDKPGIQWHTKDMKNDSGDSFLDRETGGIRDEPNDYEDSDGVNLAEESDVVQKIPISTHQSGDFPQTNDTGPAFPDETVSPSMFSAVLSYMLSSPVFRDQQPMAEQVLEEVPADTDKEQSNIFVSRRIDSPRQADDSPQDAPSPVDVERTRKRSATRRDGYEDRKTRK